MDKTHNISLGGFSFLMEEKAYYQLSNYLKAVQKSLGENVDTEEVIYDIEQRMAELLKNRMGIRQVVIAQDIDYLISVLGEPEQYLDDDFSENTSEKSSQKISFKHRKLYRDTEDKKLGGVLSGLSYYFDIEVVWLRIIFLLLMFLFGTGVVLYIVLWLIIPLAKTTAEKLEMKGSPVNLGTISSFKNEENSLGKQLYRSRKNRLLGGVLGGISQVMKWETSWVRIIFLLVWAGVIPFLTELSGALSILYIILWIAIPSEKQNTFFDENTSEETNNFVDNQQNTSMNFVQIENNTSVFRTIFKGLAYLLVGFITFLLLIIAISLFTSLLGVGVAGLGVGIAGIILLDYVEVVVDGRFELILTYISVGALLLLPFSVLVILSLKLFSKKGYQTPRFWVFTNVFLFFFGVLGMLYVIFHTAKQFRFQAVVEQKMVLPSADTLLISDNTMHFKKNYHYDNFLLNYGGFYFEEDKSLAKAVEGTRFYVMKTTEKEPFMLIQKHSYGRSISNAEAYAEQIDYPIKIEANSVFLPKKYFLGKEAKLRKQNVLVCLYLPEGKYVGGFDKDFLVFDQVSSEWVKIEIGQVAQMTEKGLICQKNDETTIVK